jgi:protein tyrosine phosphatase (PTP) superfamily phosphohydrolase (DUF442 family)
MRVTSFLAAAFILALTGSIVGQDEWTEFVSPQDGFKITFPGTPKVQDITWTSQMGYPLPARVFSISRGTERYAVTVVDYRGIEKQGTARSLACVPGAETCFGGQTRIVGAGYWKSDVHGAITYATFKLLQQHGTPTGMTWNWAEQVEGTLLQFTNADQSRTSASIYMHDNRLYIVEGTVPKGYPEPELFKMSVEFTRPDGTGSNIYSSVYNTYMGLGESPLPDLCGLRGCSAVGLGGGAGAQVPRIRTRREDFPGLENYFPIDGTASNGGQLQSRGLVVTELAKRGFKSVIDVAGGPDAEAEGAAVRAAGLKYFLLTIDLAGSPGQYDPAKVEPVLKAMTDPANQPAYLHSGNGDRTAMLWMIKRVVVDGWSVEQAGAEATTIGLVNDNPAVPAQWKFAQDYISAHPKK